MILAEAGINVMLKFIESDRVHFVGKALEHLELLTLWERYLNMWKWSSCAS